MMTDKVLEALELLDKNIVKCTRCDLYVNGSAKPYWTPLYSNIAIVGEAPGKNEVDENTPFCGKAGKILMDIISELDLSRENFLILNSVNCRPMLDGKNGKPKPNQMAACKFWIEKYFRVLKPHKVLLLGGYAAASLLNVDNCDIIRNNGSITVRDGITYVRTVHPAYTIYDSSGRGLKLLKEGMTIFSKL